MLAKRKAFELDVSEYEVACPVGNLPPSSPTLFYPSKRQRTTANNLNQSPIHIYNQTYLQPNDYEYLESNHSIDSTSQTCSHDETLITDAYSHLNRFNKRESADTPTTYKEPTRKRRRTLELDESSSMNAVLLNANSLSVAIPVASFTPVAATPSKEVDIATKLKNGEAVSVRLCGVINPLPDQLLSLALLGPSKDRLRQHFIQTSITKPIHTEHPGLALVPYVPLERYVMNILGTSHNANNQSIDWEDEQRQQQQPEDENQEDLTNTVSDDMLMELD